MTLLDRPCDRCDLPDADVGWDHEALCLPCFLTDLHGRQLAAQAAIARKPRTARSEKPRTFDPAPLVYRGENSHTYHQPGPQVFDAGPQSACGRVTLYSAGYDAAPEVQMAHRAKPCGLCFPDADLRHRTLLAVTGAPR